MRTIVRIIAAAAIAAATLGAGSASAHCIEIEGNCYNPCMTVVKALAGKVPSGDNIACPM